MGDVLRFRGVPALFRSILFLFSNTDTQLGHTVDQGAGVGHWILWTLFDNKAQAALDLVDFARQQSTSGTGLVVEFAKAKHKHGKAA